MSKYLYRIVDTSNGKVLSEHKTYVNAEIEHTILHRTNKNAVLEKVSTVTENRGNAIHASIHADDNTGRF